jgi:hypothetical protein
MDLALRHVEVDAIERDDIPETFGDSPSPDRWRFRHAVLPRTSK